MADDGHPVVDRAPATRHSLGDHALLDRYTAAFASAAAAGDLGADLDPVMEAAAFVSYLDGIRLQWFLLDRSFSMADSALVRRHDAGAPRTQ